MNDMQINDLMALLPPEYLDEAVQYRMAHMKKDGFSAAPQIVQRRQMPHRLLGAAAALSAAACLTAVFGLGLWFGSRMPDFPVESHAHDITEVCPETVTTTVQSETSAKPESETRLGIITQTTAVSGTELASETQSASAKTQQNTTASQKTAAQTETGTKTHPTIAGRAYDPEITAKYRLGDVNMDGVLDSQDAILLQAEYTAVVLEGGESLLTPEQLVLGDCIADNRIPLPLVSGSDEIQPQRRDYQETDYPVSYADSFVLIRYIDELHGHDMHADQLSLEEFIRYGRIVGLGTGGCADRDMIWRYTDASEESVQLEGFGALPVHVGAFTMTGYWYHQSDGEFKAYYRCGGQFVTLVRYLLTDEDSVLYIDGIPSETTLEVQIPEKNLTVQVRRDYSRYVHESGNLTGTVWDESGNHYYTSLSGFASEDAAWDAAVQFIGISVPESQNE
ncbi:MAG: hypothetical protein J6Z40_14170 [Oscillospiraceae bacterium]|nr:hypothetical protein [Oscillospiraceae bacterium]